MKSAAALLLAGVISSVCAAEDSPNLSLVKGASKPDNTKPAVISYTNDGYDGGSRLIQAAIISKEITLDGLGKPGVSTFGYSFGAGISKDSAAKSASDTRVVNANLGNHWDLTADHHTRLHSTLTFALEDDRQNGDRGHSERLDAQLDTNYLKFLQRNGPAGELLKIFPFAGLYRRHITSTSDETKAPTGNYGGPYVGVHFVGAVGEVTNDAKWFERIGLDASLTRIRDSSASGGYVKQSYNFATGTVSYALHDYTADRKSVWKPSLGITRNVGTDRLNNLPQKGETVLGLQISYGI